jgi:hypothetical protein
MSRAARSAEVLWSTLGDDINVMHDFFKPLEEEVVRLHLVV